MKYLNLGCGYQKRKGCINIDCGKEYKPDLVWDIKELPYEANSIDGIYATDVLEHIPKNLILNTLKSWYKILKVGGFLILRLPNVRKIAQKYIEGRMNCDEFSRLIYGGQGRNKIPNFHKSGFDKKSIIKLLSDIGFKELKNNIKIKCNHNNMLLNFGK